MERVLHPSLVKCLSSLSIRSPQLKIKLWMEQKKAIRATTLIKALRKPTLHKTGCSFEDLLNLYLESNTREAFRTVVKERGINSKPLREKLEKALGHSPLSWHYCRLLLLLYIPFSKEATNKSYLLHVTLKKIPSTLTKDGAPLVDARMREKVTVVTLSVGP